jgi:hypothetical protein
MGAFNHVRPLAWAALMAVLTTAVGEASSTSKLGTFEVDSLFPRNATYAPRALMPIVFALQNPTLASTLEASIFWELWEGNNRSSPGSVTNGGIELATLDLSSSDPLLVTRFVNTVAYPDGLWTLAWSLEIYACSQPEGATQDITLSNATIFTTSASGQPPDLVAATAADLCGTTEAYAFAVTSSGDACGVLGPSPATSPCAVTISPAAASSISAAATALACSPLQRQLNPNVTCPASTDNPSASASASSADAAGRSRMAAVAAAASTLLMLLATLTALVHLA